MALIGTIRRNFWFVLLVLGLALAAFVFMDVSSAPGLGGANTQLSMGTINGNEIDYNEFQRAEEALYSGAPDMLARRSVLWDYFVEKAIVDEEADNLGLSVSYEELMDLQFGANLSPIIQQNFRNPQTGQVDFARLQGFKNSIENGEELDPNFRAFWSEQEKQVVKAQLQDKISTLASKAVYTPTWMAQKSFKQQNQEANLSFVKIPYDQLDGADISLTDADYKNYINANKAEFTNKEETRTAKYIVYDVKATAQDSADLMTQMRELSNEFKTTPTDSIFAINHNGVMPSLYYAADALPTDSLKAIIPSLAVGDVAGPWIESGNLVSAKLIDKRVVADSVKARHILRTVTAGNITQLAAANKTVDSLISVLQTNRSVRFDSLAAKFSQDPTAATNFGDLGYFAQGTMVPEFNQASFISESTEKYRKIQTQFGVHLIEVVNKKYLNRNPKYRFAVINESIIPSEDTQNKVYDEVAELIGANPYIDAVEKAIADKPNISIQTQTNIGENDIEFAEFGSNNTSRDIVRWLFNGDSEPNDVSPDVFTFTDEVKYFDSKYVIVGLSEINAAGLRSVSSVKDDIANAVINFKKAEAFKSNYSASDLSTLASKYGVSVDTVGAVKINSFNLPGIGDEPKVVGEAFKVGAGNMTNPIDGNSGIFVVKPIHISEPGEATNIPNLRNIDMTTTRSRLSFGLLSALKDKAKIEDQRSKFY